MWDMLPDLIPDFFNFDHITEVNGYNNFLMDRLVSIFKCPFLFYDTYITNKLFLLNYQILILHTRTQIWWCHQGIRVRGHLELDIIKNHIRLQYILCTVTTYWITQCLHCDLSFYINGIKYVDSVKKVDKERPIPIKCIPKYT